MKCASFITHACPITTSRADRSTVEPWAVLGVLRRIYDAAGVGVAAIFNAFQGTVIVLYKAQIEELWWVYLVGCEKISMAVQENGLLSEKLLKRKPTELGIHLTSKL